ncbi:MAG: prepilin-type N-terminal cleavage/methylation domain-containing protein [Methylibium sp.]|uniref:type IV pilin protein n=1 Tax=Methylibium sp. TaxID=2067992 RepID=UPI001851184C|nr:type IV pilin protein [Methylibium sp.]MBA3597808.1 prepilin-type N-terminal cleavage/methylation domain-containing protein [Methylibium sp.]
MHKHGVHGLTRRPGALQGSPRADVAGFTLIELMLVVTVIGVLAAIAYPSYMDQARRGRRADAIVAMTQVQQAQERWRGSNSSYATSLTATPTDTPPGLGLPGESPRGYYGLNVSGVSGTGYTLTATAAAGKGQSGDTGCTVLTIAVAAGVGTHTPVECWSR